MIGEGIDYEREIYNPKGEWIVDVIDDEFAQKLIFSCTDNLGSIGYDGGTETPPDNGNYSELDPNPGTGGGDSEIVASYL